MQIETGKLWAHDLRTNLHVTLKQSPIQRKDFDQFIACYKPGRMYKRWLILSHAFNMDGRAASQTITDKVPYLLREGIQIEVLSAVTGVGDDRFPHRQLLPWGPSGLRFDFRHWVARKFGRGIRYRALTLIASLLLAPFILVERLLLGLPSQWSWALPATFHGWRKVRSGSVDLVYSTGGAWSAHLAGWWLKRITGVTWIAEIHDPLVVRSTAAAYRSTRRAKAQAWLERKICTDADLVWWFTEQALAEARKRNPQLGSKGFAVPAGAEPPHVTAQHAYTDSLNIGHFGSLDVSRSLAPFLNAVWIFSTRNSDARSCLRIHVYGSVLDSEAVKLLKMLQLDDLVIQHGRLERDLVSGRSGREQIVVHMQTSDVLLLLHGQSDACAEYIPSKLYEYFWAQRPIFALTHNNPQLDAMIRERNGYLCATANQGSIVHGLEHLWHDWKSRALPTSKLPPVTIESTVEKVMLAVQQIKSNRRGSGERGDRPGRAEGSGA